MKSTLLFNDLHGKTVRRDEILDLLELAKSENNTPVIFRLFNLLNSNDDQKFYIEIIEYNNNMPLNGPQHTGDYKIALDECGRLRKGYKFQNGKVVKVELKKKQATSKKIVKKVVPKKTEKEVKADVKKPSVKDKRVHIRKNSNDIQETTEKIEQVPNISDYKPVFSKKYGKKSKRVKKEIKAIEQKSDYPFSKDEIPYETARRAHYWTSFSPEKRAVQEQEFYYNSLKNVYDKFIKEADKKGLKDKFFNLFDKYKNGFLSRYLDVLRAKSNTASTMITGGSGFNVRRNEKKLNILRSKEEELSKFNEKFQKYFNELLFPEAAPIKTGKTGSLERLEEKLQALQQGHEFMVKANAEIRKLSKKYSNPADVIRDYKIYLKSEGLSEKEIDRATGIAERDNSLVFLPYYTTNSSANIRRVKEQIELEKKLKQKAETVTDNKFEFDGGHILFDYSDNKVKIYFDSIPSQEIRSFIKKSGQAFKWSPFNKVWQRQLNTYYRGAKEGLFDFLKVSMPSPKSAQEKPKAEVIQTNLFDGMNSPKKRAKKKGKPLNGIIENVVANVVANAALGDPVIISDSPSQLTFSKNPKVQKIGAGNSVQSIFFKINGETGKFLQRVERKPNHSVVITMDGEQGAGKTTTLFKFMNDFAAPGNKSLFISGEEDPASELFKQKVMEYLSTAAQNNLDAVGDIETVEEFYELINQYEIIFIDSWQKLQRMIGKIRLDEDLRKKFDGKVFVIIFQQTTDGRTKGGSEVVFDGDIIIKMVKEPRFSENYAYFDKNRYTLVDTADIRYNIATGTVYNPNQGAQEPEQNAVTLNGPKLAFIVN